MRLAEVRGCPRGSRRGIRECALPALVLVATATIACGSPSPGSDELRVGLGTSFASLDPHAEATVASLEQLSNVYDPLATLDAEMRVRPSLASSWENPDPLTWRFHLRQSVRFHDGSPLTADDVVFSLSRLVRDDGLKIRSNVSSVEEVSAQGPAVVVLRTRWPDAQLLNRLSNVLIVPTGSTPEMLRTRANGTGAYSVESWTPRKFLRLRRNQSYWGPQAEFRRVTVELALEDERARSGLAASSYDVLRAGSSVEDAAGRDARYAVVRSSNIFLRHLAFDVSRETTPFCPGIPNPFRKRPVREAIALAIDRTRLAARVDPEAVPATQVVPQAIFGHSPGFLPPAHDPERARRLLSSAGLAGGFDVTLHRSGFERAAEEVRAQLAGIGIRVTVVSLPSADFFAALNRRELSFWMVANGCTTGDALEVLWDAFHSVDPSRGAGVDNYAGYRNPDLDRTVEEAARLFKPSLRLPVLQRALKGVLDDVVWIPLYHSKDVVVVGRSLSFRPRADGLLRYAEVKRTP